jgi:hypothetical protein
MLHHHIQAALMIEAIAMKMPFGYFDRNLPKVF